MGRERIQDAVISMGKKSLCKLVKKDVHIDDPEFYSGLVDSPRFLCKKCGRSANDGRNLCKPRRLGK